MRAKISFCRYKVELGHEDVGQKARSRHAARDRPCRCRGLGDLLASPAGLLGTRRLDHLQPCADQFEDLAHVFTDEPQLTPAVARGIAGIEHDALAGCCLRDLRFAPRGSRFRDSGLCLRLLPGGLPGGGSRGLQRLEGQLQLFDLALDLLGARTELLRLVPGNPDLECLNESCVCLHDGREPRRLRPHGRVLGLECGNHRAQPGGIVRRKGGGFGHAKPYPVPPATRSQ
jgi:hypothetical protein